MDRYVTEYLNARLSLYGTPIARPVASAQSGPVARLQAWQKKRRARRDLQALDDRLLADIGLDRTTIGSVVEGLVVPGSRRSRTANDNSTAHAA